jgi:hypothetical protein
MIQMPKLAIYVPKEDMKEIERWRKKLNFSKIFMHALRREIRDRSRVPKASEGQLAKAAEHYRRALAQDLSSLVDAGYELGSSYVLDCKLSTEAIRKLRMFAERDAFDSSEMEAICELLGGRRVLDELARTQGLAEHADPISCELICRGYARGVADVWEKVCERLHADSE